MELTTLFNYGVPTGLLLLVLFWARPHANRLVNALIDLLRALTVAIPELQTELKIQTAHLQAIRVNGCGHTWTPQLFEPDSTTEVSARPTPLTPGPQGAA